MIDSIVGVTSISNVSPSDIYTFTPKAKAADEVIFDRLLQIDEKIGHSEKMVVDYIQGKDIPTHELMMALGKAKSQLRLAVEVRNSLVTAYKSITSMQI